MPKNKFAGRYIYHEELEKIISKAVLRYKDPEIKKLNNALIRISQIDWSDTKESESVKLLKCVTWAEEALKG